MLAARSCVRQESLGRARRREKTRDATSSCAIHVLISPHLGRPRSCHSHESQAEWPPSHSSLFSPTHRNSKVVSAAMYIEYWLLEVTLSFEASPQIERLPQRRSPEVVCVCIYLCCNTVSNDSSQPLRAYMLRAILTEHFPDFHCSQGLSPSRPHRAMWTL